MTNQKTPEQGGNDPGKRELTVEDHALATAASLGLRPDQQLEMMNIMRRAEEAADVPKQTPVQGGATEEQIEAAARERDPDAFNLSPDEYARKYSHTLGWSNQSQWLSQRLALRYAKETLSAPASAHPADEHHDAEERETEPEDHAATVTGDRPVVVIMDEARETDEVPPCARGVHRWAWLTSGGQACGICGALRGEVR